MDDLLGKLQQILSSEEGQAQLREVASMLGVGEGGGMPDLSALQDILGGNSQSNANAHNTQNAQNTQNTQYQQEPADGGPDIGTILRIAKAFSGTGGEDKNTQLLYALKPHLREENQHKVDEAAKILRLIALLPLIKDSGLLGGLFGGDAP